MPLKMCWLHATVGQSLRTEKTQSLGWLATRGPALLRRFNHDSNVWVFKAAVMTSGVCQVGSNHRDEYTQVTRLNIFIRVALAQEIGPEAADQLAPGGRYTEEERQQSPDMSSEKRLPKKESVPVGCLDHVFPFETQL
ncbi:unnamed protein product [Pleuronectes platessa]|uniref:Uncharacterized protein n=1 Tax=Pleuronectes platessa TaxID=8262 RepID=A0A9N7UTC9_PLEPL|nr:unnamed protein product [Pleuronectes platessa]